MQLPQARKKNLVNLTPLIDVVFILLIFFMLVSNFDQWNSLELSVGGTDEIEFIAQDTSVITIKENSIYLLNKQELTFETIVSNLRSIVNKNSNHPITIQPESGANVQSMVDLLKVLKEFANNNISIIKPSEEDA